MLPLDTESPVHMQVHPWLANYLGEDATRAMTLEEFDNIAADLEKTFRSFMKLRRALNV